MGWFLHGTESYAAIRADSSPDNRWSNTSTEAELTESGALIETPLRKVSGVHKNANGIVRLRAQLRDGRWTDNLLALPTM